MTDIKKNGNWSELYKKEDWLACWIGFIVIAIACVAVIAQWFDFSALKFGTWYLWEDKGTFAESMGKQLDGAFWGKMLRTFLVLGILFTIGVKLMGENVKKFIVAFLGLFIVSVVVRWVSAEFTLNRYLEWAFWALLIGLLISNTVGTPE